MKTFTDNKGRSWDLDVNCWSIGQVRDLTSVDLPALVRDQKVAESLADPVILCGVLWVLIRSQAKEQSCTDEEFGRAMAGEALGKATEALLEEIVDFFSPEARPQIKKLIAAGREIHRRATERVDQMLDDPKMIERAAAVMSPSTSGG